VRHSPRAAAKRATTSADTRISPIPRFQHLIATPFN
jgi:hypothetical protein